MFNVFSLENKQKLSNHNLLPNIFIDDTATTNKNYEKNNNNNN